MNIKKLGLLLMLLPTFFIYAQSKNLRQFVRNWPASYDTTGKHWFIYQYYQPVTHVLDETSLGSVTLYDADSNYILWNANIGNFNGAVNPWNRGDTIVMIGSIDTAYINNPSTYPDNPNHCGFYWLFSDTVTLGTPEYWQPHDTLRSLTQPVAALAGTDIQITFTNPNETTSNIGVYNVFGYWLWADTTGSGTPSKFNVDIGFIPVQGGPGDSTIDLHPISGNYLEGQTVLWAYFLVATPDTGGSTCPGYSTYYSSRNSNAIVIIGIEETNELRPESKTALLKVNPNPFRQNTRISYKTQYSGEAMGLRIYDVSGKLIKSFDTSTDKESPLHWDGSNNYKHQVPEGVYFIRLESPDITITRKIIKLK